MNRQSCGREEILGADEILGLEEMLGREEICGEDESCGASLRSVATAPLKLAKRAAELPLDVAEWAVRQSPTPQKSWFIGREEILGERSSRDEREVARDGGRCERSALRRTTSGYNGAWRFSRPSRSGAEGPTAEQLEELRARADAGDARAARALQKLREAGKTSVRGETRVSAAPTEQRELDKLADIRKKAAEGDAPALAQAKKIARGVRRLQERARKGDASASRALALLEKSGLFGGKKLGADQSSGEDQLYPDTYLTDSEYGYLETLITSFNTAFNRSYATGKPFRNPLSNNDMAFVYKMRVKEQEAGARALPGLGRNMVAEKFLKYIDKCLTQLKTRKIPISG